MKIVFRADAGDGIGDGHLSRDLALAEALRKLGADCRLLTRPENTASRSAWVTRSFAVEDWLYPAGKYQDIKAILDYLDTTRAHALVVDNYAFDEYALNTLSRRNSLVVFDDLAVIDPSAELVINQNPGAQTWCSTAYNNALKRALGSKFACLRRTIVDQPSISREGVLIAFGNAQPNGLSTTIATILSNAGEKVTIVAPETAMIPNLPNVTVKKPQDFAPLLAAAEVSVIGGGVTSLEACHLGTPSIVLPLADNQVAGAQALASDGSAICVTTPKEAAFAAVSLLNDDGLRYRISLAARRVADGMGPQRLAKLILDTLLHKNEVPDE